MKQMSRDPQAAAKARKAERRADEKSGGITIKPVYIPSSYTNKTTGFKKGGFKNAFGSVDDDDEGREKERERGKEVKLEVKGVTGEVESESEEEWGDYDPRRPTGCGAWCEGRDRGRI